MESTHPITSGGAHEPGVYEIRLRGGLDERWSVWFDGLTVEREAGGTTLIRGPIADQAALHGLLQRIRDLGLPLFAVTRVDEPGRRPAADEQPARKEDTP